VFSFQIFEWWYFRKYGTSFIEQVSLNHISPWIGGGDTSAEAANAAAGATANGNLSQQPVPGQKQNTQLIFKYKQHNLLRLMRTIFKIFYLSQSQTL